MSAERLSLEGLLLEGSFLDFQLSELASPGRSGKTIFQVPPCYYAI